MQHPLCCSAVLNKTDLILVASSVALREFNKTTNVDFHILLIATTCTCAYTVLTQLQLCKIWYISH